MTSQGGHRPLGARAATEGRPYDEYVRDQLLLALGVLPCFCDNFGAVDCLTHLVVASTDFE